MLFFAFLATFLILWAVVYATLPAIRHVGRVLARRSGASAKASRLLSTTRERYRDRLPVRAILAAGARLTAWAGDGFIDLAESGHAKGIEYSIACPRRQQRAGDEDGQHRQVIL